MERGGEKEPKLNGICASSHLPAKECISRVHYLSSFFAWEGNDSSGNVLIWDKSAAVIT